MAAAIAAHGGSGLAWRQRLPEAESGAYYAHLVAMGRSRYFTLGFNQLGVAVSPVYTNGELQGYRFRFVRKSQAVGGKVHHHAKEFVVGPGEVWSEVAARLLEMSALDPRLDCLAGRPEGQAVAQDFLTMHRGWETDFEVFPYLKGFGILWKTPHPDLDTCFRSVARFEWEPKFGWSAFAREFVEKEDRAELTCANEDGTRWISARQPLRYLPEFASFITRFREGGE